MLSASASIVQVGPPVDVSREAGPQAEAAIAIDPTNSARLFVGSNENGASILAAASGDAGATWAASQIATGADGLATACCDPSAAFDSSGNLFYAYLGADTNDAQVLLSTDGGQSFGSLAQLAGNADQPTVTTGAGSVWVAFQDSGRGAVAYGAPVNGLGQVGAFAGPESIVAGAGQNVGDIAVGPRGQVLVAYQVSTGPNGPSTIDAKLDSDGTGPKGFGSPVLVSPSNVGDFESIPAQARRTIDAEAGLAYDLSGGPFAGRAYLVYTDENPAGSGNTDIFLRYSDDDGSTWSAPLRVNDDTTQNSQFFPRIAVDPSTGAVAVTWYDARNDQGVPGQGSTNDIPNDDVEVYGAVGVPTPTGIDFGPNVAIQPAPSNSAAAHNPNDFGDYTGLTFLNGSFYPAWADNSDSTGDNPDGPLGATDILTAKVDVQVTPPDVPVQRLGTFGQVASSAPSKAGAGGGALRSQDLNFTTPAGARVTLSLTGGSGQAFQDGDNVDLTLNDAGKGLRLTVRSRGGRVSLGDVNVRGSLLSLSARDADLAGTLAASGPVGTVTVGNVSGGTIASAGTVGKVDALSLAAAQVLSGANFGPNGRLGGPQQSFVAGFVGAVAVRGAVTGSVIAAGVDPGPDGIFGTADDLGLGGTIRSIVAADADPSNRFESRVFGTARLPRRLQITSDPRFVVL